MAKKKRIGSSVRDLGSLSMWLEIRLLFYMYRENLVGKGELTFYVYRFFDGD